MTTTAVRLVGFDDRTGPANLRRLPWLFDALSAGATWEEIVDALADGGCGSTTRRIVVDGIEEDPVIP